MSTTETVREGSEIVDYTGFSVEYRDASHRYWLIQGEERTPAVSVTGVLRVLDKPAIVGWAEREGARGALTAERAGLLRAVTPEDSYKIMETLRANGLGADAVKNAAADRGTAIHEALRLYCQQGTVPNAQEFPEHVRGYVAGLCKWLVTASPEPILTERVIGSPTYGFAGRFDLLATINGERVLADLKTSARIYPEHSLQMAGYELALLECGESVDRSIVVAVGEDGSFNAADSVASTEQFLAVLACQRALSKVQAAVRRQEKAA